MKIACVQMNIEFGEPEKNYQAVKRFIDEAASMGTDTIVLPEMWNTGYALTELTRLADENGEKTKAFLQELARKHRVNIVAGSVSTKRNGKFYNTMYVVRKDGELVAEYDKAHLFKLMDEHLYMEPGQKRNGFALDGIECAGVICYDLRFPEWTRAHVLDGAKVIFIPAEWPEKRMDHWQILLQARAIENQCYVVAVNRVGNDPNNEFNGHSMVIAPWGELLIANEEKEGIYYAKIDIEQVKDVRQRIPIFQDRREELYE
ncbi:carbon-nitrogen family hydrolase [Robertmurraya massiliosenegalensis]|uniref:carbon-nitrogen family hydrolase n=1 Tax=Robertmurraya massiliosenegalensis TaxID=1287657 RepID=UPI00030A0337|nr:carbon-nitrogen family hydrolase [Robertmurraya massiliosenegalensis]